MYLVPYVRISERKLQLRAVTSIHYRPRVGHDNHKWGEPSWDAATNLLLPLLVLLARTAFLSSEEQHVEAES